MRTVKEFLKMRGKLWAETATDDLTSSETLLWWAAGELASMLELVYEVEDVPAIAPIALETLRGADAFFKSQHVPPHQALGLFLLKLDRHLIGLSILGDETKPLN